MYHYHITIKCDTKTLLALSRVVFSKPTRIDLEGDTAVHKDRMLTKYNKDLDKLKARLMEDLISLKQLGMEVVRYKIEQVVSEFTVTGLTSAKYAEAHIKVISGKCLPEVPGTAMSKNPSEEGTRFYNYRLRNKKDLDNFYKTLPLLKLITLEKQLEYVILDSNEKHDSWWL